MAKLSKQKFTVILGPFLNHMQVVDPENILWFDFGKVFTKTCQKHHFGDNLSFKHQKIMNLTDLDSPS